MAATTGTAEPTAGQATDRVAVGVDGSEGATRALEWAAEQAARTGSVLEIHVAYGSEYVFVAPSEVERALENLTERSVAQAEKVAPGVVAKSVTHDGPPVNALLEASEGADLLVVGSRGLGGFSGLVLGSVSHKCVLHAHCPVAVVRPGRSQPGGAQGSEDTPSKRIVAGVDGSESSTAALEWALREAELTGAELVAVTSWVWPNSFAWGVPVPATVDMAEDATTVHHQVVDPARRGHPTVAVRTEVVHGHPAPTLVDASRSADLLVVGSRGHGELVGSLLGSVSEHCVSHAECPVVVMRD
jgi:nucleotide-binding universal stress UspA family protein